MKREILALGLLMPAVVLMGVACSRAGPTESPTLKSTATPTSSITQVATPSQEKLSPTPTATQLVPILLEEVAPSQEVEEEVSTQPTRTPTPTPVPTRNVEPTKDLIAKGDPSAIMEATLDYLSTSSEVDISLIVL